ncbi:MAG: Lin0512 family protein [Promethearchaeota archaeon]
MNSKRFVIQIGMGVDQHGHKNDCTKAAMKAVKNAISNNCLPGLIEICNLTTPKELLRMKVHVKIGVPFPDKINKEKVLKAIPFGVKSIEVVQGGLTVKGVQIKELGDTSDLMIVCNAAVEVSI